MTPRPSARYWGRPGSRLVHEGPRPIGIVAGRAGTRARAKQALDEVGLDATFAALADPTRRAMLAQLSTSQISDAFRSSGYNSYEVSAYTRKVQERIRQLNQL